VQPKGLRNKLARLSEIIGEGNKWLMREYRQWRRKQGVPTKYRLSAKNGRVNKERGDETSRRQMNNVTLTNGFKRTTYPIRKPLRTTPL
jgi:hypothetical protein